MPPTKPPYPPEFRREAVQLADAKQILVKETVTVKGSKQTLFKKLKIAQ